MWADLCNKLWVATVSWCAPRPTLQRPKTSSARLRPPTSFYCFCKPRSKPGTRMAPRKPSTCTRPYRRQPLTRRPYWCIATMVVLVPASAPQCNLSGGVRQSRRLSRAAPPGRRKLNRSETQRDGHHRPYGRARSAATVPGVSARDACFGLHKTGMQESMWLCWGIACQCRASGN